MYPMPKGMSLHHLEGHKQVVACGRASMAKKIGACIINLSHCTVCEETGLGMIELMWLVAWTALAALSVMI